MAVPNQQAAIVFLSTPADSNVSFAASSLRSAVLVANRSPKAGHPTPPMAARAWMPLLAIAAPQYRSGLPKVVVDAVGGVQPAERHLHSPSHRQLLDLGVGELDGETAPTVEVDDGEHDGRAG